MPHLAGVLDVRGHGNAVDASLRRFANVLSVSGVAYRQRSWQDDCFGAINLLPESVSTHDQPITTRNPDRVLFLDGEIYNAPALRQSLQDSVNGHNLGSDCELCMALYEREGDAFVSRLNGQFNIVVYEKRARTVTILNDRFAYRPLYISCHDGLSLFALERKAILAALENAPELDPLAVLELFAFGHHLEDRTLFQGIVAMPQGAVMKLGPSGVEVRQYWRPAYQKASGRLGINECAEEMGRLMIQATARRVTSQQRKGIFLSGGLDSRAVGGALARATTDVTAFTFGADTSPDVIFGRQLAERLGYRHRHLIYPDDCYDRALPRVVWRTEGAIPFDNCISVEHHKHIGSEIDVSFNGHFGDALTGGHILPQQFAARHIDQLAQHILAKRTYLRLPELQRIFSSSFLAEHYPRMLGAVRRVLQSFDHDRPPLLANLWDLTQRQRRFTFCSPSIDRYLFEQITPFVDNDLVDFCLTMPLRFLVAQRAYKRMIVYTFPEIAAVPWARTSRPVPTSFTLDMARQGGRFVGRKLTARLRRLTGHASAPRKPTTLQRGLRHPGLHERLDRYFASELFPAGMFDGGRVKALVTNHFGGHSDHTRIVADLLTLAESTRLFFESPIESPAAEVEPELAPCCV